MKNRKTFFVERNAHNPECVFIYKKEGAVHSVDHLKYTFWRSIGGIALRKCQSATVEMNLNIERAS